MYAIRSAGSRGAFDVVACNASKYFHIQSKCTATPKIPADEKRKFLKHKLPPNADRQLWWFDSRKGHYGEVTIYVYDKKADKFSPIDMFNIKDLLNED